MVIYLLDCSPSQPSILAVSELDNVISGGARINNFSGANGDRHGRHINRTIREILIVVGDKL